MPKSHPCPSSLRKLTPLCLAARQGDVELIFRMGSNPSCDALDSSGWSALMHASALGRAKSAQALLSFCDPNLRGALGRTALMRAAERGRCEILEILLPHCDAMLMDDLGLTAHDLAPQGSRARHCIALWTATQITAQAIAMACASPMGKQQPLPRI